MTRTTKWFGFEGRIPSVLQGIIYGLGFGLINIIMVPWICKFTGWYWVDHVGI